MGVANILNKLNVLQPSVANQPLVPAKTQQPAAPVRPQGDTFVRSASLPAMPQRPAMPAAAKQASPTQDMGFVEMVAKNPALVWNTSLTPRTQQAIESFKRGQLGNSVRDLDFRNMTAQQVRGELKKRGFSCDMGTIKDVRTGQPVVNPRTGKTVPMEIWSSPDGGMVRIKPEGDPTSRFRPQPHLSVSVKYPPSADGHDFNDEAFKVDYKGNPMPKWAKDLNCPFPAESPAGKKFYDDHANSTHINLR